MHDFLGQHLVSTLLSATQTGRSQECHADPGRGFLPFLVLLKPIYAEIADVIAEGFYPS